jgi:hypothetical protein
MTVISAQNAREARSFLETVELPIAPKIMRGGASAGAVPPAAQPRYVADQRQAVAIGSQIAEFAASVPQDLRPQIANSFLMAQLAANKYLEVVKGGTKEWYERFSFVLANTGWVVENQSESLREVSGDTAQVHKEIIPIVAAILGPAAAAASIVIVALNGLANMAKDSPWITLFHRESQRAKSNQFQIGYVDAPAGKGARISLACFDLDASQSVTQVLFFKVSSASASLRHFASNLSLNEEVFATVQDLVQQRIHDQVARYIARLEI